MSHTIVEERGNLAAAPGSHSWAIAMRRELQFALRDAQTSSDHLHQLLRLMEEHKGYRELRDQRERLFRSYEAFCTCKYPFGLGYRKADIDRIIEERRSAQSQSEKAGKNPLLEHGKNSKQTLSYNVSGQGTSAEYLARRIARDRPDILERMKAGEFRSVRQAALEAGIVKRSITVPIDPEAAVRLIVKHFKGAQLETLIRGLAEASRPASSHR